MHEAKTDKIKERNRQIYGHSLQGPIPHSEKLEEWEIFLSSLPSVLSSPVMLTQSPFCLWQTCNGKGSIDYLCPGYSVKARPFPISGLVSLPVVSSDVQHVLHCSPCGLWTCQRTLCMNQEKHVVLLQLEAHKGSP